MQALKDSLKNQHCGFIEGIGNVYAVSEETINDTLELLKEQEPKQVIGIADSIEGMEVGYCPSCDRTIINKKVDETKFCKFCGQAVKWNA